MSKRPRVPGTHAQRVCSVCGRELPPVEVSLRLNIPVRLAWDDDAGTSGAGDLVITGRICSACTARAHRIGVPATAIEPFNDPKEEAWP